MSNSGDFFQIPATCQSSTRPPGDDNDLRRADPLLNLSAVRARMDSLHQFLSHSVNNNTLIGKHQMEMVSAEISSAIHQIIVNGAALLSCSQLPPYPDQTSQNPNLTVNPSLMPKSAYLKAPENVGDVNMQNSIDPVDLTSSNKVKGVVEMKVEVEETKDEISSDDWEIIELDAVELLAEHVHFCEICGKGFKRDANLRMHMRAHGNQFKTPEALAKPAKSPAEPNRRNTRFSCPYAGCNRNRNHKKFRPLKSAICVKNHFKRSHCPKMYSCTRCNKKSFSVVADLKSHLKHCGESKWKCSCGTTFSRKDKLFSHMALFEGHMPAVMEEEEKKKEAASVEVIEDDEEVEDLMKGAETGDNSADDGFFDGLLDGFDAIDGYSFQDVLGMGSPSGLGTSMNEFYNF